MRRRKNAAMISRLINRLTLINEMGRGASGGGGPRHGDRLPARQARPPRGGTPHGARTSAERHASDDTRAPPRVGPARRRAMEALARRPVLVLASGCLRRRGDRPRAEGSGTCPQRATPTRAELPPRARGHDSRLTRDEAWAPRGTAGFPARPRASRWGGGAHAACARIETI